MVPFGLLHICFRLNSFTRPSSGVMVAHFTNRSAQAANQGQKGQGPQEDERNQSGQLTDFYGEMMAAGLAFRRGLSLECPLACQPWGGHGVTGGDPFQRRGPNPIVNFTERKT
jgi:hypothetical protein